MRGAETAAVGAVKREAGFYWIDFRSERTIGRWDGEAWQIVGDERQWNDGEDYYGSGEPTLVVADKRPIVLSI